MKKSLPTYIIIGLFLFFLYIAFLVVKPFITVILAAAIATYIFYPVYRRLLPVLNSRVLASAAMILIILLVLSLPVAFVVQSLANEAVSGYSLVRRILDEGLPTDACDDEGIICSGYEIVKKTLSDAAFQERLKDTLRSFVQYIVKYSEQFVLSIPGRILSVFLFFFMCYYFFKDGKEIMQRIWDLMPLHARSKQHIQQRIGDVLFAVVYGSLLVAFIQGLIAGIGYWIFGIKAPILWGLVTALFALLPVLGTTFVWLPASLYLMLNGFMLSDSSGIFRGIGLFLYGALIVSTIDNVLKPKIIGHRGKVHPVIVLLGVFGGLIVFGPIGIIVGPVVLALFITFVNMYYEESAAGKEKKNKRLRSSS